MSNGSRGAAPGCRVFRRRTAHDRGSQRPERRDDRPAGERRGGGDCSDPGARDHGRGRHPPAGDDSPAVRPRPDAPAARHPADGGTAGLRGPPGHLRARRAGGQPQSRRADRQPLRRSPHRPGCPHVGGACGPRRAGRQRPPRPQRGPGRRGGLRPPGRRRRHRPRGLDQQQLEPVGRPLLGQHAAPVRCGERVRQPLRERLAVRRGLRQLGQLRQLRQRPATATRATATPARPAGLDRAT